VVIVTSWPVSSAAAFRKDRTTLLAYAALASYTFAPLDGHL